METFIVKLIFRLLKRVSPETHDVIKDALYIKQDSEYEWYERTREMIHYDEDLDESERAKSLAELQMPTKADEVLHLMGSSWEEEMRKIIDFLKGCHSS